MDSLAPASDGLAFSHGVHSIEIGRAEPGLPVPTVETVQQELESVSRGERGAGILLSVCGTALLCLAGVGIFGLISLSVNPRAREIGIRPALGASRGRVVRTVLKQSLGHVAIGLTIGLLLRLALVRTLASQIAATATAPAVYLAVVLVLGSVSLIAVFIPARRASKTDPMVTLRCE